MHDIYNYDNQINVDFSAILSFNLINYYIATNNWFEIKQKKAWLSYYPIFKFPVLS